MPLAVQNIVVDSGNIQRSMVRSLTIAFSGFATLESGAFEVTKLGPGGGQVGLSVSTAIVDNRTVATLTFTNMTDSGGSLTDGRYYLTIHADRVLDAAGQPLDGLVPAGGARLIQERGLYRP